MHFYTPEEEFQLKLELWDKLNNIKSKTVTEIIEEIKTVTNKRVSLDCSIPASATPFISGINRLEVVEAMIILGADIEKPDMKGRTALSNHCAIRGNEKIVELLLKSGAKVNTHNFDERKTPLFFATPEATKMLLEYKADPNIRSIRGKTPLHCSHSDKKTALLLEAGANPNIKDIYGRTPLFYARSSDIIKLLTEKNVDVNILDNDGLTPYIYQIQNILENIEDYKNDEKTASKQISKDLKHKVLSISDGIHTSDISLALLNGGADPNILGKDDVGLKCNRYLIDTYKLLNESNTDKNGKFLSTLGKVATTIVNMKIGEKHETMLHILKNPGYIRVLSEYGLDPNTQDTDGKTALHKTVNSMISEVLLSIGADVSLKDNNGETAVSLANKKFRETKELTVQLEKITKFFELGEASPRFKKKQEIIA